MFDRCDLVGAVDFDTSTVDRLVIERKAERIEAAHPLYRSIQDFP